MVSEPAGLLGPEDMPIKKEENYFRRKFQEKSLVSFQYFTEIAKGCFKR